MTILIISCSVVRYLILHIMLISGPAIATMTNSAQSIINAGGAITSAVVVPGWVELCSKIAPISSIILFAAPIPTILQIIKNKNVGTLPLLPYSSMASNAALWTTYGILRKESTIYTGNGVGLILAICYLLQFIRFSPSKSPTLPGSIKQHISITSIVIILSGIMTILPTIKSRTDTIGTLAVIFCIGMFTSPLSVLQNVIKTKSASSIPLPLALASVINCFLWLVTGIIKMKDLNVIIPNVLGLISGLAQISLKIIYNNKPTKDYDLAL